MISEFINHMSQINFIVFLIGILSKLVHFEI